MVESLTFFNYLEVSLSSKSNHNERSFDPQSKCFNLEYCDIGQNYDFIIFKAKPFLYAHKLSVLRVYTVCIWNMEELFENWSHVFRIQMLTTSFNIHINLYLD